MLGDLRLEDDHLLLQRVRHLVSAATCRRAIELDLLLALRLLQLLQPARVAPGKILLCYVMAPAALVVLVVLHAWLPAGCVVGRLVDVVVHHAPAFWLSVEGAVPGRRAPPRAQVPAALRVVRLSASHPGDPGPPEENHHT